MRNLVLRFAILAGAAALSACTAGLPRVADLPDDAFGRTAFGSATGAMLARSVVSTSGTLPTSRVRAGRDVALGLPVPGPFDAESVSWKIMPLRNIDRSRGLKFRYLYPEDAGLARVTVWLESGDGWYVDRFRPRVDSEWQTIEIVKTDMEAEGPVRGFGPDAAKHLGFTVERTSDKSGAAPSPGEPAGMCYIADLALLGNPDAPIAVVWNESAAQSSDPEVARFGGFANRMVEGVSSTLDALGLDHIILSDYDLAQYAPPGDATLVLPFCPELCTSAKTGLESRLRKGDAHLVSFGPLPDDAYPLAGLAKGEEVGGMPRRRGEGRSPRPRGLNAIGLTGEGLKGLPARIDQRAWRVYDARPARDDARVAAVWLDAEDNPTTYPAILVSKNAVHTTSFLWSRGESETQRIWLAMLGHFRPEAWETATAHVMGQAGALGDFESFDATVAAIEESMREAGRPEPEGLAEARRIRAEAQRLFDAGQYAEVLDTAGGVSNALADAYCYIQEPKPGEFRAVWCHNAYGPRVVDWDEAIRILAENGFTAILPNMCWGGIAYYKSDVLPVDPRIETEGDQIDECLAACKKYGVECHIWKVNWNTGGRAPEDFVEMLRRETRVQISYEGEVMDGWLCPSSPENQQLEIDAMVELAEKYDVDGVHFDYIRYPGEVARTCFCAGCRERFEKHLGHAVANWPEDVYDGGDTEQAWYEFRRGNITRVVREVAETIHRDHPGVDVSAAVFRNWPSDRDRIGQDWGAWCQAGYFDFVCPMDYTPDNTVFESMLESQMPWVGDVPCVPGIGMGVWPDPGDIVKLIDQITIARRLGAAGFTIFNYEGAQPVERMVPLLGRGMTKKE